MSTRSSLLLASILLAMAGCGVAPPFPQASSSATGSTSAAAATPPDLPCVAGADGFARTGDLDNALATLVACDTQDLGVRARRVEILVELGDLAAAKALAATILTDSRAGYAHDGSTVVARANAVLALPEPVAAPRAEAIASARKELESSRRAPADRARAKAKARHAMARAYGVPGVPSLVSRSGNGRWAGNHPAWVVTVRPLAPGGVAEAGLAVGDLVGASVDVTTFIQTTDASALLVTLPGDPGGFALSTPTGVRVFATGKPPVDLDASGTPLMSPNQRELAVIDRSQVTFFDVATWSKRASVAVDGHAIGEFTEDGAYLLLLQGDPKAAIIDVERATVLMEEPMVRAIHAAPKRTVVTLSTDTGKPTLSIHPLGKTDKPRRVTLDKDFEGWPGLEVDGDRILVIDYVAMGHMSSDRRFMGAFSLGTGAKLAVSAADRAAASAEPGTALLTSLEAALPKDTRFTGSNVGNVGHAGPAPNGVVAATTFRCVDRACSASESGLVVLDTNKKAMLQSVPLVVKDGFSPEVVSLVDDGRFALACGSGSFGTGAFVVDVTTGRSTLVAGLTDCWSLAATGPLLWTSDGVRDFGGDQSSDRWPALARVDLGPFDAISNQTDQTVAAEGPGRYCRFGEALESLDACLSNI